MKPEKPLIIESGAGGFGATGQNINQGGGQSVAAPTAPPSQ
jgi:hypothetical protein